MVSWTDAKRVIIIMPLGYLMEKAYNEAKLKKALDNITQDMLVYYAHKFKRGELESTKLYNKLKYPKVKNSLLYNIKTYIVKAYHYLINGEVK